MTWDPMSDQQPMVTLVCIKSKSHQSLPLGHSSVLVSSDQRLPQPKDCYSRVINDELDIRWDKVALDGRQVCADDASLGIFIAHVNGPRT